MGFFFPRRDEARKAGPRPGRVFRPVLLVLVVMAVCWGFWNNQQQRFAAIVDQGLFSDQVNAFSRGQRQELITHLKAFKKDFGIPLEVNVLKRPPAINQHNASRIYLDIVPAQGRAFLHMPPLVRHAVGEAFIRDLETALQQDFAAGDWRPGLVSTIFALRAKLAEVTR